ncbi:MAG: sensor histidine kinase [Armatimonadetes bacterium]|nr:MAG: sensor histidine kinase [Armatimonadota bacterium]
MLPFPGQDALASARWVTIGLHSLFLVLTGVAVLQQDSVAAVLAGVALAGWYVIGIVFIGDRGPGYAIMWVAVLTSGWALVTLTSTPDFVWLAFPLFFLNLLLLPPMIGVSVVVVVTAVAVVGLDRDGTLEIGEVVGPAIGASVAVVSTMAYRALASEHRRTQQLLAELVETRGRLVAAEREKGALVERRRLAREVHDTIAQGLSSIVLLSRAEALAPSDNPAVMHQIGEIAKDNLDEARRIVSALSPHDLEGGTLSMAIEQATRVAGDTSGIATDYCLVGDPSPLPVAQELTLLRVAQGALANASAHSHASHIQVTLSYLDDRTTLDVVDDGIGFVIDSVATRTDGSGFGLQVMRDRLDEVAGTLTIESAPDEGTAIVASIPWHHA